MRVFKDLKEAVIEIAKDIKELGLDINSKMIESKVGYFPTVELCNYGFTVLEPKSSDLDVDRPLIDYEWLDQLRGIQGNGLNPGTAYKKRLDLWEKHLEVGGKPLPAGVSPEEFRSQHYNEAADTGIDYEPELFSYTCSERFALNQQILRVIRELSRNPTSRQLCVSVWDPCKDSERIGHRRVPRSLSYQFLLREGALHMTYFMRSCDFENDLQNDIYLALKLQHYVAGSAGHPAGVFTQIIGSFYKRR